MKKFAENFTKTFPWAQCEFIKNYGANTVVFHLPQSKDDINEWLERKYNRKRNIIEIIRKGVTTTSNFPSKLQVKEKLLW
jgi:glycerol-3-phosphate cytidylyltransferase-like family protein